jgi:hypothetical protein
MTTFKAENLKQLVGNKIFTVEFVKKDGSIRVMNCMIGVKKHLQGGELKHNPESLNHLIVYDMQSKGYRTININTLLKVKFEGKELTF